MLRRVSVTRAAAVPRSVWDPTHHNKKWVDSYALPIARRRVWPAKVWSLRPDPQTPSDWLRFSKRNLAYQYNARLRACIDFPEMVTYYQEMKERGVKIDVDTAYVMISRATRYEHMRPEDVFQLFDELVGLGARADIAVIETLHTAWDNALGVAPEWREVRRRDLIDRYNELAEEFVDTYGEQHYDQLMLQEVARCRNNLVQLGSTLRYTVWAKVIAHLDDARDVVRELAAMYADRVGRQPTEHTVVKLGKEALQVPRLAGVMRRHSDDDDEQNLWARGAYRPTEAEAAAGLPLTGHWEDHAVNRVFLAVLARIVDAGFRNNYTGQLDDLLVLSRRAMAFIWRSGVMVNGDVFAQLFDVIKYAENRVEADKEAQRMLLLAYAGGMRVPGTTSEQLQAWRKEAVPINAKVLARYVASRRPWGPLRFAPMLIKGTDGKSQVRFAPFSAEDDVSAEPLAEKAAADEGSDAAAAADGTSTTEDAAAAALPQRVKRAGVSRDRDGVHARWADLRDALNKLSPAGLYGSAENTLTGERGALAMYQCPDGVQLLTAQALFLRDMYAEVPHNFAVCEAVLGHLEELKHELDALCMTATTAEPTNWRSADEETPRAEGPETECVEAMLVTLRTMLDFLVVFKGDDQAQAASRDATYKRAVELRQRIVDECATRYEGKFKMLWLQEA